MQAALSRTTLYVYVQEYYSSRALILIGTMVYIVNYSANILNLTFLCYANMLSRALCPHVLLL